LRPMKIEKIGTILKILHIRKIKPYAYFNHQQTYYRWWGCELIYIESTPQLSRIWLDEKMGGASQEIPTIDLLHLIEGWLNYLMEQGTK
jgi:hypothetical protein